MIAALLVAYSTNSYDLSLLVLSLALVADHLRESSADPASKISLLAPAMPLMVSPIWFFLWMQWESLNLMAVFLLWWAYAIRKEVVRLKDRSGNLRPSSQPA